MQLCDVSSVSAAAIVASEQSPEEFVYVRVKEYPKELIPTLWPRERAVCELPRSRRVCGALVFGRGLGAAANPASNTENVRVFLLYFSEEKRQEGETPVGGVQEDAERNTGKLKEI